MEVKSNNHILESEPERLSWIHSLLAKAGQKCGEKFWLFGPINRLNTWRGRFAIGWPNWLVVFVGHFIRAVMQLDPNLMSEEQRNKHRQIDGWLAKWPHQLNLSDFEWQQLLKFAAEVPALPSARYIRMSLVQRQDINWTRLRYILDLPEPGFTGWVVRWAILSEKMDADTTRELVRWLGNQIEFNDSVDLEPCLFLGKARKVLPEPEWVQMAETIVARQPVKTMRGLVWPVPHRLWSLKPEDFVGVSKKGFARWLDHPDIEKEERIKALAWLTQIPQRPVLI